MKLALRKIRLPLNSFTLELDVEMDGEVIAIFGPSGSGKTSLLDLVAGLRKPQSAFIGIGDAVLTDTHAGCSIPPRARGIGYVPQDDALFPHLSVRANLAYGSRRTTDPTIFSLEHVVEVLEIAHLLHGSVSTISGGEKQRIALARAILSQPRLLLLDEPLASLDEGLKTKSIELLRRVRAEFAVPILYVSHSADEITALCDKVLVLNSGRMIRHGTPAKIFTAQNLSMRPLQ